MPARAMMDENTWRVYYIWHLRVAQVAGVCNYMRLWVMITLGMHVKEGACMGKVNPIRESMEMSTIYHDGDVHTTATT